LEIDENGMISRPTSIRDPFLVSRLERQFHQALVNNNKVATTHRRQNYWAHVADKLGKKLGVSFHRTSEFAPYVETPYFPLYTTRYLNTRSRYARRWEGGGEFEG